MYTKALTCKIKFLFNIGTTRKKYYGVVLCYVMCVNLCYFYDKKIYEIFTNKLKKI